MNAPGDIFADLDALRIRGPEDYPSKIKRKPGRPKGAKNRVKRPKRRSKTHQRQNWFLRADAQDAFRWNHMGPHVLVLMLILTSFRDAGAGPPYVIGDRLLDELGIGPWTRDRALTRMEAAGLVTVERSRGRLPRITLVDEPADKTVDQSCARHGSDTARESQA
jgi:hypothetical protein